MTLVAAGTASACGGGSTAPDAGPAVDAGALDYDMFAQPGVRYRFEVSLVQASTMDDGIDPRGGPYGRVDGALDMTEPPVAGDTFADGLTVTLPGGATATYGQLELRLVGQSTRRVWPEIPNLRVDADTYVADLRIGGTEHFRFNNGQIGRLFHEAVVLGIWEALGYPVRRRTFAWVEAPAQWPGAAVPYTLIEQYKRAWCDREIVGGCVNLWEGEGEPSSPTFYDDPDLCELGACDPARLSAYADALAAVTDDELVDEELAPFIDWDAFHAFTCLSWITASGDNYLQAGNNVVLLERADGKLQFLPYSTDSLSTTPLLGSGVLVDACNHDSSCWAGIVATCDAMLTTYAQDDLGATTLDQVAATLTAEGMLRDGDVEALAELRALLAARADELRAGGELDVTPCADDDDCAAEPDGETHCDAGGFGAAVCVPP